MRMSTRLKNLGIALGVTWGILLLHPLAAQNPGCTGGACTFSECAHPARSAPRAVWGELEPTEGDAEILPASRDTSDFSRKGFFGCAFPYFESLDVENGWLFVATNRGFQIWDVTNNANAETPIQAAHECRDIATQHPVPNFPTNGEESRFTFNDVDAPKNVDTVAATALKGNAGTVLWDTTNKQAPIVKYAHQGGNTFQIWATTINGSHYSFSAVDNAGLLTHNLSQAKALSSQCVEQFNTSATSCPGVFVGKVGSLTRAQYVDGHSDQTAREHLVAVVSDSKVLQVWDVSNPAAPNLRLEETWNFPSILGLAIWKDRSDGDYYIAYRGFNDTPIYRDTNGCLTSAGSCALSNLTRVATLPVARGGGVDRAFITYSESDGTPFLFLGMNQPCATSTLTDTLYEITNPANPRRADPPGYWESYHRENGGPNFVAPRMGKFYGEYFFRAGFSILDVHRWTLANPSLSVTCPSDGFLGDAIQCTAAASACVPSPNGYTWTSSDGLNIPDLDGNAIITWPLTAAAGAKTITVRNVGCPGAVGTAVINLEDPRPAIGGIQLTPTTPATCNVVQFAAQAATGRDPLTYTWEVRNPSAVPVASGGGIDMDTFEWATDASATAGQYTVELTLANAANTVATSLPFNIVAPAALTFISGPTHDDAPGSPIGGTVQFRAQTTGGSKWTWDYGDGTVESFDNQVEGENPIHTYTQVGNYNVTLTVENCIEPQPIVGNTSVAITQIDPLEVVRFQAQCPFQVCPTNQPTVFDQEFSGSPTLYEYDWNGDGAFEQNSASPVLTHTYTQQQLSFFPRIRISRGAQTVLFTHPFPISADSGQPDTGRVTLSGPSSGTVGATLNFTASSSGCNTPPTSWSWSFPGGNGSASGASLSVSYSSTGSKSVTVQALNGRCATESAARTVTIGTSGGGGGPLNANFTFTPTSPGINQQVNFNAGSSTGDIGSYSWDFGDDTNVVFGANPSHAFSAAGTYTVTLTVQEAGCGAGLNCFDSIQKSVTVSGGGGNPPQPPGGGPTNPDFTFTPASPQSGQSVRFDASSSTGSIAAYTWTFGDGGTGSGQVINHTFASSGTYTVSLTVQEAGCGTALPCFTTRAKQVLVSNGGPPPPTLTPAFDVNIPCDGSGSVVICQASVGQAIQFADQSTVSSGSIESWTWSFGDGTVNNSGPNVNHSYHAEGTYTVVLRVTAGGVDRQVNKLIEVSAVPEPEVAGVLIPWAVQGQGALDQLTLLYIHNPDTKPMEVTLKFLRRPEPLPDDPAPINFILGAGETLNFPDILAEPFGLDNLNGFLQVENVDTTGPLPVLFGFHRTFQEDGKSFGQGIPGVTFQQFPKSSDEVLDILHLVGLSDNADRLSFFGVTNPTDAPARFRLRFLNRLGEVISEPADLVTVRPFGQRQFQVRLIREDFGVTNQTDYRVDLILEEGGPVYPYATVLNLGSEDPTFVRASDPTLQKVYMIGALATAGLNDTQWQTDVVLSNVNAFQTATQVSFVNVGNGAEPFETQRISLLAGESLRLENVLANRWGLTDGETLGLLVFENDDPNGGAFPLIQGETYDTADPTRRFGQFMPAFTEAAAAKEGEKQILTGLQQDASFRTTLWLVNPGDGPSEFDLIYRALDGSELGRISGYRVAPGRMRQINPASHPLPEGGVEGGFTVQITVRTGLLLSAAQVVINATNDPAFVPGVTR